MEKLNKEQIEEIALKTLRNNSDKKLLTNTNVDCFCMGYSMCQNKLLSLSENPKKFKNFIIEHAKSVLEYVNDSIAYSGTISDLDAEKKLFFEHLITFLKNDK